MAGRNAPAAVALEGVSIAYALKGGGRYDAVAPCDVSVADGEFVALIGPTGCGKSTLLNAAAGLVAPASGRVLAFGEPLSGLNRRAGYLFQADALMPWKTALDNVTVGLEVAGVARAEAEGRARAMLARVGLTAFAERHPHQLSGGQRKRVALAQVLVRAPRLLLMDEPFGPLDAQTRVLMGDLLLRLLGEESRDGRRAALFVTHDLDEAIALADRVVVMGAGPASRIVGEVRVDLPRPREAAEVRLTPAFHALHAELWGLLRDEVRRAYESGAAA